MKIVFLDTETTSLNPETGDIWEIAAIVREPGAPDKEYCWQIRPDLYTADPMSLKISRFYERMQIRSGVGLARTITAPRPIDQHTSADVVAEQLARLLDGAHIVGAVPDFDARYLRGWLADHGQALTAHYHLIDVETMVAGYLHGLCRQASDELARTGGVTMPEALKGLAVMLATLPYNSETLSRAIGIDPARYERHTALGDARWVRDQYDVAAFITVPAPAPITYTNPE